MNKKLIALAVAGACVAPVAMAQTANPVTLYGRVYVTLESVQSKGGANPVPNRMRVEDQASLFGIRGTEDLGGGLKAFFQLETGFRTDSNNTTFAARNSGIGLQGGFGSILMGRWDSPFKSAAIGVDPFGDLTLSGITGTLSDGGNFDRRLQNVVQYWSPNLAGFAVRLARTANEAKTASVNPYDQAASLTYKKGPAYAFLVYEEHKNQVGSTPTAGVEEKGSAFGGSFVIGPVKLGGQYQDIRKTNRTKQKNVMANVVFTFGNNQLMYQFMNSKDGASSVPGTAQPDCDSNSLGYQYNFTRRTFFLAQYTKVDNNDASSCNFGANKLAIAAGQDPQGVSVGIRHVF